MFETQLLKPFTDITLRSLSLSPLEDMLPVGGADDMHGLLLQLSLDKTLFPGANKQSVFWLAKITLEKSTGRGCDRYPSVDGTLVETEPWPGLTSRVLAISLMMSLGPGNHGWTPVVPSRLVERAFGLPPICPLQSVFDVP